MHIPYYIYIVLAALWMAACGDGVVPEYDPDKPVADGVLRFSVGNRVASADEWAVVTRGGTRALSIDEPTIPARQPETIGVYAYSTAPTAPTVFSDQPMYYHYPDAPDANKRLTISPQITAGWPADYVDNWPEGNHWLYYPQQLWTGHCLYKFYTYSPYRPGDTHVPVPSYHNFLRFEWDNVPEFTAYDYMVADAINMYDNMDSKNGTPVPLLHLYHIMARLRFCFKIGPVYHQTREIHVKSMSVTRDNTQYKYIVTFNTDGSIQSASWSQVTGTLTTGVTHNLFTEYDAEDGHEGMLLTEDYQPFASLYIMPSASNGSMVVSSMRLNVTYDVYDKAGQLTRKDCEVSNTITLNKAITNGYYYNALLVVEPDFLYVLSDNDFDKDNADGWFSAKTN